MAILLCTLQVEPADFPPESCSSVKTEHSYTSPRITSTWSDLSPTSTTKESQSKRERRCRSSSGKKKVTSKGTPEYRARRERNNEAVRKSRQKSKIYHKEMESRVMELMTHNKTLENKVEQLTKELNVLKQLFNVTSSTNEKTLELRIPKK